MEPYRVGVDGIVEDRSNAASMSSSAVAVGYASPSGLAPPEVRSRPDVVFR